MKKLLYFLSFSMIVSSAWSQTPSGCFSSGNDVSFNKSYSNTRGITKGDFDNDGNLDVVVSNYGNGYSNRYSFVKGLGNGKFGTAISGGGGQLAGQIESSDLDGDGNRDLLLSHQTGITIYLGQGNGVFDSLTTYTFAFPKCLTLGDINEDGTTDVVFSMGSNLQALYGNLGAPETFTLSSTFNVTGLISDLRLADMNGDNHLDIISLGTNGIGVSINNSGSLGTFATGIVYTTGVGPFSLTVCDIDNDGDKDVINTNKTANTISVMKNSGSGVLAAPIAYATESGPEGIDHYDINGDGNKDIIVLNGASSTMSIYFGSSTGVLTLNQTTQCPGTPRCLVSGFFNGDTKIDFVTGQLNASFVNSFVGNAANNYLQPDIHDLANSPRSIHSNDFNGDGNKDIVYTNSSANLFGILLGNGSGGFSLGATFATGTNPTSIISGDLNNDGKMDVVTADSSSNQISVFYGNGVGGFSAGTAYPAGTGPVSVRLGLLNADAFLDIAVANQSTNMISTLMSSSGTSFGAPTSVAVGTQPVGLAIFRLDADAFADIVSVNKSTSNLTRLINNGSGVFTSAGNSTTIGSPVAIDAGDFDGDGDVDVVTIGATGIGRLFNGGTGTLTNLNYSIPTPAPQGPRDIKLLDVNNDGKMDVVSLYSESAGYNGSVILFMGNNANNNAFNYSTYPLTKFATEVTPMGIALGDFNNDTRVDLGVTNFTSKSVNILFNTTPKITAGGPLTFCNGNSVTLTSTSALWYDWSPNNESTQAISATTSGTYYTTTSSSWSNWCSSNSNALIVSVTAGPSAPTITPGGSTTFCSGGSVTLSSSQATGNQWYKDGVLISGATNQTYSANTAGVYTVTYTTAGCTSPQSSGITITASQTPVITAGGPTTFCTGGSVVLTSNVGTNIAWSNGATTPSITVTTAGTYNVTNTVGACPPLVSNSIVVTISASLGTPTISPAGPVTLCPSGSVTLTSSSATNNIWSTGATTQSIVVNTPGSYFVHLDNGSCSSANSASVVVSSGSAPATPTITAGGSTTFCTGGSVTLTSSAGTSYLWSTGATTASINVTTGGSYTVQVTNASGCQSASSAPTTVTVNTPPSAPTITPGGATTFCTGGSVTLTSSAGTSYLWSTGATTASINVTTSGSYTVQVTNASTCQSAASAPTAVTVNTAPSAPTITPGGSTTFCTGGSVTLTSSAGNSYLWSTGATTASINVTTSGSYTVQVTNASGCQSAASTATTVTVNTPPSAPTITAGGSTTFCTGGSVTLTSSAGTSYLWSTGATTASINVTTGGSYTVQVTNASTCQSAASAPTAVTVNTPPSAPTITPGGATTFCTGGSVTLTSSAGTSYLWSTGATTASITVTTGGSYTVQVTNAAGCQSAASAATTVIVNTPPSAPTITPGGATTFCNGNSVTLTSSAGTSYLWSTGATTASINATTSGSYTVQVTNAAGCQSTASAPIAVTVNPGPPAPTITAGGSTTFCAGGSVTLTSSAGTSYLWSTGATTASINATTSGSYTVQITNASGCQSVASTSTVVTVDAAPAAPTITPGGSTTFCVGGSVTLTSSAGTSYLWSTGATTASINVTTSGSYTVQVTNAAGCQSTASVPTVVTVDALPAAPTITPGGATTFCAGGSVTLTSSAGTSYLWSTGATTASINVTTSGSYTVQVTNASGCQSAASAPTVVTVNTPPSAPTITPGGATTFCTGGSVTLTSSAGTSYLWSTGATTASINVTTSGSYTVQVTNAAGCQSAASAPTAVTVNALPTAPTITPSGSTAICAGGSVTLTSSAGTSYLWSTGATTASINVTTSGSYTVQVTNAAGCQSTSSAPTTVTVNPLPAAPTITPGGATTFCAGGSVTLTSSAGTSYLWSTGATTASINVTTSGSYTVQVTNASGCQSTSSAALAVTVNAAPSAPTITPGGPTAFCAGGSVTLTSSAGTSYIWSTGATTPFITASTAGSYTVQITDANGCQSTSSTPTVVTVNALPSAPTITNSGTLNFCLGNSVTLTSSAGTSYLWSTGETTQSIVVTSTGSYTVQVTNAAGCLSPASAPKNVNVNPIPSTPTISAGGATTFCAGGSVTLTSTSGFAYLWSTGQTTQSIVVSASGNYSVQLENGAGCQSVPSNAIAVTVNPLPATPTITPGGSTTICAGASVTLTSSAGTSYLWSTGATTASINATTAGSYTVQITDANGCNSPTSATTTVTVNPLPPVPTITAASATTFCAGGSVILTSSASSGNLWSTGETTQSITVSTSGSYTVEQILLGCSSGNSATQTVTVNPNPSVPTITASGSTTFCDGGSITLTSSASSGNLWSTGETTQSITVTTSGSYSVDVTNVFGCTTSAASATVVTVNPIPAIPTITASGPTTFCSAGGSVVLTSSASSGNLWSTGETTQSITVTTTGSYTVEQILLGCSSGASASTDVLVNPTPATPTVTAASATTFCNGGSVILTSSAATGNVWSTGETTQSISVTTSGTYSVTVVDGPCSSAVSNVINVTVNPIPALPTVTAGGLTTFCDGGSVILTSDAPTGNVWSTGETTQSITVTTSGSYTVEVIELGCSSGSSTALTVTVNPNPSVPSITASGSITFCDGGSITLTSSASSGNLWSTGETTQSITVTTSGSYSVDVTNVFGCTTSAASATVVTVNPIPAIPTITASGPTTFCSAGGSVVLTSSASSGNLWSTGETTQSITVTTTGSYTVEQILLGCSSGASASTDVLVNPTPATPTIMALGFTTFCLGGSVVLTSSSATGNVWSTGETTQSITVTATGSYFVNIVDGPCTSAASNTINVTANPIPGIPTITASGATTFCSGGSVTLTSSFLLGNVWSTGQTTQSITVTTTGSYTVEHVLLGCSSGPSASMDVLVNPTPATPTITAGGATTFCDGGSVILTATAGASYLWSTGETTQSITVTASGAYSVNIIDGPCTSATSNVINVTVNPIPTVPTITASGPTTFCSAGGSVVLTSSASSGNLWSTGETTQSITVTTTGSYTIEQILLGCSSGISASTDVLVNPTPATPTITAGGATTFCDGGSVILTATAGTSYLWSTGETTQSITVTASGAYSVNIIDGPCTSAASNVINVTVNPIPAVPTITASGPTTFCSAGGSVVLTSSASSGNLWSTGETTQSITVTTTGSYTVEQILLGCSSGTSASTDVLVNPTPATPVINSIGVTTFCDGGSVVLISSSATGNVWSTGETTQSISVTASGAYFVNVVDGPCTSATSNVINVTVNPIPAVPTITASGATTFCSGGSVVLTSSATSGNLWSTGETTQSITVSTSGSYSVEQVLLGCTSGASASTTVLVNPTPATPTVTAGGPTTFCAGGSVTLTASAGAAYIWSTGETTQSITVSAAGAYSVNIVDGPCTSATSNVINVTVNPIPTAPTITAGSATTFCAGGSVVLTSSATSGNTWSTGETTQSITVTTSGIYTVNLTTLGCTSPNASQSVTVNPIPATPTITPGGPTTFCAGGSVVLTSSATSGNTWSTSETTPSITVSASGAYTVTQTLLGCTSAASAPVNITVNAIPAVPTITTSGATTFCTGGSVTLTSSSATNNLWSNGATTQSITVSTSGTFLVQVITNGCTSGTSAPKTVTVNSLPPAPTIVTGTTESICAGSSVTLTSSSTGGNLWSTGDLTQSITVSSAGSYSVTVTDGNGCTSPASPATVVTVNPIPAAPVISAGGPTAFCSGGSVTLSSSYGSNNLWSSGSTANSITVSNNGTYTVTHTDVNGCVSPASAPVTVTANAIPAAPVVTASGPTSFCAGGSVTLTSSQATGNSWSTAAMTPNITVNTSGVYSVIYIDGNGCASPSSAPVVVNVLSNPAPPSITAGGATTICQGSFVTLTSSYTSGNLWSTGGMTQNINATISGVYTVTYTNVNGCSSTSSPMTVTVIPVSAIPTISASGSTTICDGASVILTSSDPNSTWSTGSTTQAITVTTSGSYSVVGNQTGCPSQPSAPVVVNVNPAPAAPIITPSGSTTICEGEELFLFTSGTGTNTWSTGYIGQVLPVTVSGNYWVSVQNVYGCSSSSTVVPVVVNTNPIVTVNPFEPLCTYTAPFTMSNGLPAGGTYTGDGITTNIFYPSAAGIGSSIVTYTYVDINDCSASAQTTIDVNNCAGLDEKETSSFAVFPNPNNGLFKVTSSGAPMDQIIIYDAQGKMVFNEAYSGIFTVDFDLNAYANGVYYIEVNSDQEIQERMPLVINH